MALPKRKHTPGRRNRKRNHKGWKPPALSSCPQCGDPRPSHRVCPNCGFYRKQEVFEILK